MKKPSGYVDISLANIPVTLINQSIGCVYTTTTDTNGLALFELTAGICAISANQETTTGNRDYILSGSLSNIQFEANGEERSVEIPLEVSERGRLLISEIYFSGCLWPDGKNVYTKTPEYQTKPDKEPYEDVSPADKDKSSADSTDATTSDSTDNAEISSGSDSAEESVGAADDGSDKHTADLVKAEHDDKSGEEPVTAQSVRREINIHLSGLRKKAAHIDASV